MSSPNLSRRSFLRGKISAKSLAVIRPPWAVEEKEFLANCNRCNSCISTCSEKIIIVGDGGYPEVDFKRGECTFCAQCARSCEAQALQYSDSNPSNDSDSTADNAWCLHLSIDTKCLSMNAVVCRACGDSCDAQAIRFKLKTGGRSEPQVFLDDCNGCGACVSVCPVDAVLVSRSATTEENKSGTLS